MNKPIGDFGNCPTVWENKQRGSPFFAVNSRGSIWVKAHSRSIPEPGNIALVAGIIVLFIVVLKSAYEKRNGKDRDMGDKDDDKENPRVSFFSISQKSRDLFCVIISLFGIVVIASTICEKWKKG